MAEDIIGSVTDCPIIIDLQDRNGGTWTGKEEDRYVRCRFSVAYLAGEWEEFPGGPRHAHTRVAEDALRRHVASHSLADYIATTTARR